MRLNLQRLGFSSGGVAVVRARVSINGLTANATYGDSAQDNVELTYTATDLPDGVTVTGQSWRTAEGGEYATTAAYTPDADATDLENVFVVLTLSNADTVTSPSYVIRHVPPVAGSLTAVSESQGSGPFDVDVSAGFTGSGMTYEENETWASITGDTLTIDDVVRTDTITITGINSGGSATVDLSVTITSPVLPVVSAAATSFNGLELELTFSKTMDQTITPDVSRLALTQSGYAGSVSSTAWDDATTLVLTLSTALAHTTAITLAYTGEGEANAIEDTDGNELEDFASQAVTNNVVEGGLSFSVDNVNESVTLDFTGWPDSTAFTFTIGATDYTTDVDGTTLTIANVKAGAMCIVAPSISGTNGYDETLTAYAGYWLYEGASPGSFTYQWTRDASDQSGETADTYQTDSFNDMGEDLTVKVTFDGTEVESAAFSVREVLPTDSGINEAWYDASDESSISDTGGLVDQWNDLSGNANHITQTGANRPETGISANDLNSLNGITFDGSNYLDRSDALGLTGNSGLTVVIVAETAANSGGIRTFVYLGSETDSTNQACFYVTTGTNGYSWRFNNGKREFGAANLNTPEVLVFSKNNTDAYEDCELRINGGSFETQTGIGNGPQTVTLLDERFIVGTNLTSAAAVASGGVDAIIYEIQVYSGELSDNHMNAVLRAVNTKWGITTSEVV